MPITFSDYKQAKEYHDRLKSEGTYSKIKQVGTAYIVDAGLDCPFCKDTGFDKPGLKYHLETYCKKYNEVEEV